MEKSTLDIMLEKEAWQTLHLVCFKGAKNSLIVNNTPPSYTLGFNAPGISSSKTALFTTKCH